MKWPSYCTSLVVLVTFKGFIPGITSEVVVWRAAELIQRRGVEVIPYQEPVEL